MSVPDLSGAVAAALARLKALQERPASLTKYKNLLVLNDDLRILRKLVCDKINALPWGDEKKQVTALRDELDRVLCNWEYEFKVDISDKRLHELLQQLLTGGLNNSQRRKLKKERQTILALRQKLAQQMAGVRKSAAQADKSRAERIAEYEALLARALKPREGEF